MEFDIFISYAHRDNNALNNWIDQFRDKLIASCSIKIGRDIHVFWDNECVQAGHILPASLKDAISKSKLFIPILSPSYLSSEWCRQEFLQFLDKPDLQVGNFSRIFPVRLINLDHFDPPAPSQNDVNRIVEFIEGKEIVYTDFTNGDEAFLPTETQYKDKISYLTKGVSSALKQMNVPKPPQKSSAIFVGYAVNEAEALRDSILVELQKQATHKRIMHQILPLDKDAPYDIHESEEAEVFIRRQIEKSNYAILVLGDTERAAVSSEKVPLVRLQYQIAKEMASKNPEFSLLIANISSENTPLNQNALFQMALSDTYILPNIQIFTTANVKSIKDDLLDRIKADDERRAREAEVNSYSNNTALCRVFFVYDFRDKNDPVQVRLRSLIRAQRCELYTPVFQEDDPIVNPEKTFQNYWLVSRKAIVLLRNATSAWCNAQKSELLKIASLEKKSPYQMAVCVTEPEVESRIQDIYSEYDFKIIDCTKAEHEQQIIQFLNAQRHA